MATILELNSREMMAAIAGEFQDLEAIRAELRQVRERKDAILLAYSAHVGSHGC